MIFNKKKIYLIDNQDAVYGNAAYDLASLIDDVRLKTSKTLKNKIFKMYTKLNSSFDQKKFSAKIFLDQKKFLAKNFFWQKFFLTQIFLTKKYF